MPELTDFASSNRLSLNDLQNVVETQVQNPQSKVFQSLIVKLGEQWLSQHNAQQEVEAKRKPRVYLSFTITSTQRFNLRGAFPQFEQYYMAPTRVTAAYARTVSLLVSEYLLTLLPHKERSAVLYGYQVKPMMLRNRSWAHLCISGGDPGIQAEFLEDDREMLHIYDSMIAKKRVPPPALEGYMTGTHKVFCTQAHVCTHASKVGALMLDRVDTNFRQLCVFMKNHDMDMAVFAIHAHKALELGYDSGYPEVDGYIAARDGVVTVMYEGDLQYQNSYTHSNYLELLARTRVYYEGDTYVKERVTTVQGYGCYKVTRTKGILPGDEPTYKSWIEPQYAKYYAVTVPELRPGGTLSNKDHWGYKTVPVYKEAVDRVVDMATTAEVTDNLDEVITKRLFSNAHTFIAQGQVTRSESPLTVQQFIYATFMVYCSVYMRRFLSGSMSATLAPVARDAVRAAQRGFLSTAVAALGSRLGDAGNSMFAPLRSALTQFEDNVAGRADLELPSFEAMVGYREYTDSAGPNFKGWYPNPANPMWGFCPHLPSATQYSRDLSSAVLFSNLESIDDVPKSKGSLALKLAGVGRYFTSGFQSVDVVGDLYDPEEVYDEVYSEDDAFEAPVRPKSVKLLGPSEPVVKTRTVPPTEAVLQPGFVGSELRRTNLCDRQLDVTEDKEDHSSEADVLVEKFLVGLPTDVDVKTPLVTNGYLAPPVHLDLTPGFSSADPIDDARTAIMQMFDASLLIDTTNIEAHRLYADVDVLMKATFVKVDVSRLEALKPESAFIPKIRGHVMPHIKDNMATVLQTLAKRNANTPYTIDPSDTDVLWNRVWKAMCEVYYVDGADAWLKTQPKVAPNATNLREWLAKQPESKVNKLLAAENPFTLVDLATETENLYLMLKGKLKPEMDASYSTAVKLPQSVQYDRTGKSVAALSPAFRDLVKRELFILKPNVLIMQRKSPANLVNFLNMFDHRDDHRGKRYYIEIDQVMFDKAQTHEILVMYLKYLQRMGLLEDFCELIANMSRRTISDVKAGVKASLADQNISGAAFTLHRNNGVSLMILAIFLMEIKDQIEFIMVMGDDVTVAVRGEVDVSRWEGEMNRMFNMSAKIKLQVHGYFCSYDIIHRPDGTTTIIRDIVKAMLGVMQQDYRDPKVLEEVQVSFADSMGYVTDGDSQMYAIENLPLRWSKILPGFTGETAKLLIGVLSSLVRGRVTIPDFYSEKTYKKHY